MAKYTREGRNIIRNGEPFVLVGRSTDSTASPYEADEVAKFLCWQLNDWATDGWTCPPASAPEPVRYPRLWLDVAIERGAKPEEDGAFTGAELDRVGVAVINGCAECHATVSPANSYQRDKGDEFSWCAGCAGVE